MHSIFSKLVEHLPICQQRQALQIKKLSQSLSFVDLVIISFSTSIILLSFFLTGTFSTSRLTDELYGVPCMGCAAPCEGHPQPVLLFPSPVPGLFFPVVREANYTGCQVERRLGCACSFKLPCLLPNIA